jgi:hypothetical protein
MASCKNKNTFDEEYIVSLNYQKQDGYWVYSHKESFCVPVSHGVNEKDNHDEAAEIARKKYPNCKINSVTLC